MVDFDLVYSALQAMRMDFPHIDGLDKASSFKMAGHFLVNFISESPIKSKFDEDIVGHGLFNLPNHQNVMTAFQLAIDGLDGATIISNDPKQETITLNRIQMSKHSYFDIIEALHGVTPNSHYKMVTVLLEQMVYKSNPDAQYELVDI